MSLPRAFRVTELYAFLAVDSDGDEGVPVVDVPRCGAGTVVTLPLVAADQERVAQLRVLAQGLADQHGRQIMLARFTVREDVEVIEPAGGRRDG